VLMETSLKIVLCFEAFGSNLFLNLQMNKQQFIQDFYSGLFYPQINCCTIHHCAHCCVTVVLVW